MAIGIFACGMRKNETERRREYLKREFVASIETYMGGEIRSSSLKRHPSLLRAITHVDSGEWDAASACLNEILFDERLSMAETNRV